MMAGALRTLNAVAFIPMRLVSEMVSAWPPALTSKMVKSVVASETNAETVAASASARLTKVGRCGFDAHVAGIDLSEAKALAQGVLLQGGEGWIERDGRSV